MYPMVWEVAFDSWTTKGSIQFPEFVRVRDDKAPEECTIDQRP
jgi:ATP-dependent DNA ligase